MTTVLIFALSLSIMGFVSLDLCALVLSITVWSCVNIYYFEYEDELNAINLFRAVLSLALAIFCPLASPVGTLLMLLLILCGLSAYKEITAWRASFPKQG
ncbi:hypothetical protein BJ170DRAFT_717141 [Xylariales sp. AK1849]|nr:hypothetical protein BJ170DRAFT_717141 [Xylariales sp. AK1849]